MSTYGDLKKAWAREWTRLRREYLDGKVLDAVVLPSRTGVRGGGGMPRVWRRRHRRDQQPTRYDSRTQPHAESTSAPTTAPPWTPSRSPICPRHY